MQRVVNSKQRLVNSVAYLSGKLFALTDKGRVRDTNEDYAVTSINAYGNILLIVCDGMGGANKGEYASSTIAKTIVKEFNENEKEFTNPNQIKKWINKVVSKANKVVFEKAQKEKEYLGMGTTLSLVILAKDILVSAQVGDSRIYLLKDNKLSQLSVDQTYVQYLSHNNKITQEETVTHKDRHKLTNALGTKKIVNVDINDYIYNHEKILICSDGLYNNVSEKIIESILVGNDSLDKKCQQLIAFGNAGGGSDNMAVVIWESN